MAKGNGSAPSVIRAALRGEVIALIPEIVTIVLDEDEPAAARVRAFETIARYGLGVADMGQVTVEVAGDAHFGVIAMPTLEQRPELGEGEQGKQGEIVRELPLASPEAEGAYKLMSPPASSDDEAPHGEG